MSQHVEMASDLVFRASSLLVSARAGWRIERA